MLGPFVEQVALMQWRRRLAQRLAQQALGHLLYLSQPGVTPTNPDSGAAGNYSIGGGRTDSVTYLLDGGLNNDLLGNNVVVDPNPDAIAEFRVLESTYGAEYGRNAGAVVNYITKS